jgi:hypothetical protein
MHFWAPVCGRAAARIACLPGRVCRASARRAESGRNCAAATKMREAGSCTGFLGSCLQCAFFAPGGVRLRNEVGGGAQEMVRACAEVLKFACAPAQDVRDCKRAEFMSSLHAKGRNSCLRCMQKGGINVFAEDRTQDLIRVKDA